MVSLEEAVVARYETGGNRFEILIDPESAKNYKDGMKSIGKMLSLQMVYGLTVLRAIGLQKI